MIEASEKRRDGSGDSKTRRSRPVMVANHASWWGWKVAQSFMVAGCSSDGSVARLTNNDKNLKWRTYDEQSTRFLRIVIWNRHVYEILFLLIIGSLLVSTIDCSIIESSHKLSKSLKRKKIEFREREKWYLNDVCAKYVYVWILCWRIWLVFREFVVCCQSLNLLYNLEFSLIKKKEEFEK